MNKCLLLLLFIICTGGLCRAQQSADSAAMCYGDTATMWASAVGADSVQWYTLDGEPIPGANNDTFVTLNGGKYFMRAFSEHGLCWTQSDDITVHMLLPEAFDDHFVLTPGRTEALNILLNDEAQCSPFDRSSISIIQMPTRGTLQAISGGMVTYKASTSILESDVFTYRIKDMQGHWSNIATVRIDIDLSCAVMYPNPVYNELNIIVDSKSVHSINMYDAAGRYIKNINVDQNHIKVDMSLFSQGMYLFEMLRNNQKNCTEKISKIGSN